MRLYTGPCPDLCWPDQRVAGRLSQFLVVIKFFSYQRPPRVGAYLLQVQVLCVKQWSAQPVSSRRNCLNTHRSTRRSTQRSYSAVRFSRLPSSSPVCTVLLPLPVLRLRTRCVYVCLRRSNARYFRPALCKQLLIFTELPVCGRLLNRLSRNRN